MCALEKVVSGQPINIPATTYNAMIDAARKANSINTFNSETTNSKDYAKVSVLNSSGSDLDRFFILGIDEPIILPADDQEDFESRITVDGVTPEDGTGGSGASDHRGRFVVLQEPIPDGEIGKSRIAGETLVKIDVIEEAHEFADVTDGEPAYLTSSSTGSARILWKESGTGEKWALIRLGDDSASKINIYNDYGSEIPANAAMEVVYNFTEKYFEATRPTADNMSNVIINDSTAIPDDVVKQLDTSYIFDAAVGETIAVGDSLGTEEDSFDLLKDNTGFTAMSADSGGVCSCRFFNSGGGSQDVILSNNNLELNLTGLSTPWASSWYSLAESMDVSGTNYRYDIHKIISSKPRAIRLMITNPEASFQYFNFYLVLSNASETVSLLYQILGANIKDNRGAQTWFTGGSTTSTASFTATKFRFTMEGTMTNASLFLYGGTQQRFIKIT